jgi:hypothetical protein
MSAFQHLADCSVSQNGFHLWCDYQSDLYDLRIRILISAMISCEAIPVEIAEQFLQKWKAQLCLQISLSEFERLRRDYLLNSLKALLDREPLPHEHQQILNPDSPSEYTSLSKETTPNCAWVRAALQKAVSPLVNLTSLS